MTGKWSRENTIHTLKVLGFLVASNVVTALIAFMAETEFPKEYSLYVSLVNLLLVSAKEFLSSKR